MAGRAEASNVRRHPALIALLLAAVSCGGSSSRPAGPTPAAADGGPIASSASDDDAGAASSKDKLSCPPTVAATDPGTVSKVHVVGNARVIKHDICMVLTTKAGKPYDAAKVAADLRTLFGSRDFDDVQAQRDPSPTGSVVTFVVRERPVVDGVQIDGNSVFDFDTLRKLVPMRGGGVADPADLRDTIAALRAFYVGQGYRSAQIDYKLDATTPGHAEAHFTVSEGAKAVIRTFAFQGLSVATDAELRAMVDTQGGTINAVGGRYDEASIVSDLSRMQVHLNGRGLLQVTLDAPALTLSADGKALSVSIAVHEGPLFRLDKLHFTGTTLAGDEKALIKIFPMKTGDVFARDAVLAGVAALKAFQAQKGKPVTSIDPATDVHADKATVDLTLHELP